MLRIDRLLNLTNLYQLLAGNCAHRYSAIFGNFRLSHWALINLALIHGLYWSCLWTHYAHQDQLHVLRSLSPLLHDCIYAHLFVGIFSYAIVALEYRKYMAFSGRLMATVHSANGGDGGLRQRQREWAAAKPGANWWHRRPSCDRLELFVYYKMWINTAVLLALVAYNLSRIDWSTLTRVKVMLFVGLAYPHLLVANVLRFYTVHAMVVNSLWTDENEQLAKVAGQAGAPHLQKVTTIRLDELADTAAAAQSEVTTLRGHLDRFQLYHTLYADLNRLVQLQLGLLLKKHSLVVFICVHVYVKVRLLWHTVLTELDQHLMTVNGVTFVVMMANDYVCLLVVSMLCQREVGRTRSQLLGWCEVGARAEETLRLVWSAALRMKDWEEGGMRLMMLVPMNARNFVMMIIVQLIFTAIIFMYQYFNTKIDEL